MGKSSVHRFLNYSWAFTLFLTICSCQSQDKPKREANKKPNILFIAIDDLRPELGTYGSDLAVSPHLDQLASESLQFNNAYCQQAICGPSRASVLTGLRPETSGIFHNYIKIRDSLPNVVTLPQHFKNNGYTATYFGKIFHHGDKDDAISWSYIPQPPAKNSGVGLKGFALKENQEKQAAVRKEMFAKYGAVAKYGLASGPAFEKAEVPDETYIDGYNTAQAIQLLQKWKDSTDQPLFLGLGFNKPHLNWIAPKKYWDLYDTTKIANHIAQKIPDSNASMGLHPSFELRVREGIPKKGTLPKPLQTQLLHAYLACVSYVDAQIGKLMQTLETTGLKENTIVVVWSDHGYHLGDMDIWGKATNYEIATRVPLLVSTPDMPKTKRGKKTNALVELVDLYPTLTELAGLKAPKTLDGLSFAPLLQNPDQSWKKAAFSQFPTPALREWGSIPLRQGMRETYFGELITEVETKIALQMDAKWDKSFFEENLMGYSMRTPEYRLIAWKDRRNSNAEILFTELYDLSEQPYEQKNIAQEQPELTAQLLKQLNQGFKAQLPQPETH